MTRPQWPGALLSIHSTMQQCNQCTILGGDWHIIPGQGTSAGYLPGSGKNFAGGDPLYKGHGGLYGYRHLLP